MDNIGHSIVALAFLRLQIQRASQIIPASPRCGRAAMSPGAAMIPSHNVRQKDDL